MPPAWISLTLSRHFSLLFIASGRSSGLHPVSSHSCCMYVRAGRLAFARSYVGVHRNTSLMSSSLLLQQCPACLVRLISLLSIGYIVCFPLATCPSPVLWAYVSATITEMCPQLHIAKSQIFLKQQSCCIIKDSEMFWKNLNAIFLFSMRRLGICDLLNLTLAFHCLWSFELSSSAFYSLWPFKLLNSAFHSL